MTRRTVLLAAAILTTMAAAAAALTPRIAAATVPERFELDFRAFGYVEEVEDTRRGCRLEVAVYEWVNLSRGFEIGEIPRRDDRYRLIGDRDSCRALTVAMAGTGPHIAFGAGRSRGRWYLSERPSPAYGCGGLEIDWTPAPKG